MSYWGKFIGGMAGFAMGGPVGALFGAALGHAADEGKLHAFSDGFSSFVSRAMPFDPLRVASLLGQREHVFAVCVTVLAAKLCKCDGPVSRVEIDAFKASFTIPPDGMAEVARLFDNARDSAEGFESYARQIGQVFADDHMVREQLLAGLYQIAKADGPVNQAESQFLSTVALLLGLNEAAYQRAGRGAPPPQMSGEDPYAVLGVSRHMSGDEIRQRWKQLMRENHPDSLTAQGASVVVIEQASARVARINAAYDCIKRTKGL